MPSTKIAVECGFTSVQYMYAVFQRELGVTPARYRQNEQPRDHADLGSNPLT
jgi:LacI family transcriptional regulator